MYKVPGELSCQDMGTISPTTFFFFFDADVMADVAAILPPWRRNISALVSLLLTWLATACLQNSCHVKNRISIYATNVRFSTTCSRKPYWNSLIGWRGLNEAGEESPLHKGWPIVNIKGCAIHTVSRQYSPQWHQGVLNPCLEKYNGDSRTGCSEREERGRYYQPAASSKKEHLILRKIASDGLAGWLSCKKSPEDL